MPNYTLFYFNGRGRAEICRMLLEAAGAPYVDKRFEFSEWDSYRNDFPGMCLPVLEMEDGYRMTETMSICRHLAREHGFYGRSNLEMLRCDYICDCLYQLMDDHMRFHHWRNGRFRYNMMDEGLMYPEMNCPDMKYPAYDHYMYWRYINTCNRLMPFLERTLETCNYGSQFFLGDEMMWCDMMFYSCMESPFFENQSIFSNYPLLMSLWLRVAAHPRICNYLNNRTYSMW